MRFHLRVNNMTADSSDDDTLGEALARKGTSIEELAKEFLDREDADDYTRRLFYDHLAPSPFEL